MHSIILLFILATALGFIIFTTVKLNWHPVMSLLLTTILLGIVVGLNPAEILALMRHGFADILGSIGLIVVLGSMIGLRLEQTGAIAAIGHQLIRFTGNRHPGLVLALLGAVLGIPVFCDSGFLVLINLAKSISVQSAASFPALSLSLATGLYGTHTLVPPTPGPVAAAANLGVTDTLGWVMLSGILVAIPAVVVVYFFISFQSKKIQSKIDLGKLIDVEKIHINAKSLSYSLLMLIVPLVLIAMASVIKLLNTDFPLQDLLLFMGSPAIALLSGYMIGLLAKLPEGKSNYDLIQTALQQAGPILVLTGCGAAFGRVISGSEINFVLVNWIEQVEVNGIVFLLIAFLLASFFKTIQGSSTSALIISSVIIAPLSVAAGFVTPWDFALLISALGAGAMTLSHANDSYFWVVIQMSGFDLKNGLRGMSIATIVQGISALLMVIILYLLTH
ncbi:MAG TPA: hypothetical protein PKC24_10845 [Cyclobacteriaceae bacterium]|nr:hypothetical protein [Cyclobacteriaceae bacterium]